MIRQFRIKTLEQKKINKYLFYAIGEILIVIIGILIAVQINLRIEKRNIEKNEIKLLKGIHENLTKGIFDLQHNLVEYKKAVTNDSLLLKELMRAVEITPDIEKLFLNTYNFHSYLLLYTSNLDPEEFEKIKNKNLRGKINKLYEFYYVYILHRENSSDLYYDYFNKIAPKLRQYLTIIEAKSKEDNGSLIPKIKTDEYYGLLKDRDLKMLLFECLAAKRITLKVYIRTHEKINNTRKAIEIELKSRGEKI